MMLQETTVQAPPSVERFSINTCFDEVKKILDKIGSDDADGMSYHCVMDAEVSYTYEFFDEALKRSQAQAIISKHWLPFQSSNHCMEHSESWPYKPQWEFGFEIDGLFFFISNLEPYVEKTKEFLKILRPVLPKISLVGQNIKFDLKLLADIMELTPYEALKIQAFDLIQMAFSLGVEQKRFNLKVLADKYLECVENDGVAKYVIGDELIETDWKQTEDFHRTLLDKRFEETTWYNRQDILITRAIFEELLTRIRSNNITRNLTVYNWFIPFHMQIERVGVYINTDNAENELLNSTLEGLMAELDVVELAQEIFAEVKNRKQHVAFQRYIASSKDREALLKKYCFFDFDKFQFKPLVHSLTTKKSEITAGPSCMTLNTVSGSGFREVVSLLLSTSLGLHVSTTPSGAPAYQREEIGNIATRLKSSTDKLNVKVSVMLNKLLQMNSLKANLARLKAFYVLPAKLYPDKRLHHDFKLAGTETGRLSNVRPGIMNMPLQLKKHIVSQTLGGKIIQIDLKSAEAKLFMLLTQNEDILKELLTNPDTYSVIGQKVFNIKMCKKSRPIERNIMKIGVLAKMYGQGLYGSAESLKMYYIPVLWEIYLDKEKYKFIYDWEYIKITDNDAAEKIAKKLASDTIQAEIKSVYGNLEDLSPETRKLMIDLEKYVIVDFFRLAVKCDIRLEEAISSGDYEDWLCRTFFNMEDPANSYVHSPIGLIRNLDMSADGLVPREASDAERTAIYTVLKKAFNVFFVRCKEFKGSFFTGTEWIKVPVRRLHAINAFTKLLKKELYMMTINELLELFEEDAGSDFEDALFYISRNPSARMLFTKASGRLQARYRECLNFPLQGTSSFINSYLGKHVQEKCCEAELNVDVVNTVHDAVHFEVHDPESDIDEFVRIADEEYVNQELLKDILEAGLRELHPSRSTFNYIPIGGDIEICDNLGEAK